MPAYRSDAEAEVRESVVAKLRRSRPDARIMHEINMVNGANRADVLAVSRFEIIGVEVKSQKDKLDLLPGQISSMRRCCHSVVAAIHQKHSPDASILLAPREAEGAHLWWFPEPAWPDGAALRGLAWSAPDNAFGTPLPPDAIWFLWREEMLRLCDRLRIAVGRSATRSDMAAAIRWQATGQEITKGICAALRARKCIEADPPIVETANA